VCTVIVGVAPDADTSVALAVIRDEFLDRPWAPPARHWPGHPGVIGGIDLRAGGTWLAADPAAPRVAVLLNGTGLPAPEEIRRSRGDLPLRAVMTGELPDTDLVRYDPFHLIVATPSGVRLWSWDGTDVTEDKLPEGVHVILNSPWDRNRAATATARHDGHGRTDERGTYFRPRFAAAPHPGALPGVTDPAGYWGEWLRLASGADLDTTDPRALVVRREIGGQSPWGTSSISLLALADRGLRYDFCPRPGDLAAWGSIVRP